MKRSHLGVGTGTALLVLLLAGPLVQLGPQRLGLPVVELGLELVVEDAGVGGLDLQVLAELLEGLERALAGGGLDEVVEQDVGEVHPISSSSSSGGAGAPIPHGPGSAPRPRAWNTLCLGGSL